MATSLENPKIIRKLHSGLSLIGVVVALFILSVGTLATSQLVAQSRQIGGLAREKFIALNLAREGLELAANLRDTNWFTPIKVSWVAGLCETSFAENRTITIDRDLHVRIFVDDKSPDPQLYQDNLGNYTHKKAGNALTPYKRLLTVDCRQQNPADPVTIPAFIEITSRVSWQSRGSDREVSLKTRLYDWLRLPQPVKAYVASNVVMLKDPSGTTANRDDMLSLPNGVSFPMNTGAATVTFTAPQPFDFGVDVPTGIDLVVVSPGNTVSSGSPDTVKFGYGAPLDTSLPTDNIPDNTVGAGQLVSTIVVSTPLWDPQHATRLLFYDFDSSAGYHGLTDLFVTYEAAGAIELDSLIFVEPLS